MRQKNPKKLHNSRTIASNYKGGWAGVCVKEVRVGGSKGNGKKMVVEKERV